MATWLYSGAAVTGQSHLSTAQPCQDKFKVRSSSDGAWLAVAVCDGAGSAEFAEIGASITSNYFCDELINLSQELNNRTPGAWINDYIIDCVVRVREQLRLKAKSDDIRKYHCTLVAALLGRSGGFLVHIGDGAILGGIFEKLHPNADIELNSGFTISLPENGEYSNETFFVTEGNWVKHLRITPLPTLDWLVVCTDGGASLLLDNKNNVKPNFLAPFIEEQANANFADKKYVETILSDPKANKLTTDDKTIVVAVRNGSFSASSKFRFSSINDDLKHGLLQSGGEGSNTNIRADGFSVVKSSAFAAAAKSQLAEPSVNLAQKKNYQRRLNLKQRLISIFREIIISLLFVSVGVGIGLYWKNLQQLVQPSSNPKPTQNPPLTGPSVQVPSESSSSQSPSAKLESQIPVQPDK